MQPERIDLTTRERSEHCNGADFIEAAGKGRQEQSYSADAVKGKTLLDRVKK